MRVLCSYPGKFGDILWALPTVRAIAEAADEPVDLVIAGAYGSMVPLLQHQSYLGHVWADRGWQVENTAPMTPREPPVGVITDSVAYDQIFHLGYRGWPEKPLPFETLVCAQAQWPLDGSLGPWAFHLDVPWIEAPYRIPSPCDYAVGFTDEHFELKYGLTDLLLRQYQACGDSLTDFPVNLSSSPRWNGEASLPVRSGIGWNWESAAAWLGVSRVFLGCNSALHVLACAMGVPVVMMEPNPHRHNEIFYPFGKSGQGVELVCGTDGLPTFDSRHVWDVLQRTLADASARSGAGSGDMIASSNLAPNPMATSGSNVPPAATAPPDGLSLFLSEQHENLEQTLEDPQLNPQLNPADTDWKGR